MATWTDLKVKLIATGDEAGAWGITTNENLGTALEEAIVGRSAVALIDGSNTISLTNSTASQAARNYILNCTGALTATATLIVPSISKPYIIENNTTGSQSILVKTSAGTGVTVPNGKTAMVYANSTNVVSALSYIPSITTDSLTSAGFSGPLNGTVGATTATTGLFTTIGATGDGTFSGTGQVKMPAGNTAQRSGAPSNGMFRYNSQLVAFEGYVGGIWSGVGGAQAGGVIFENSLIITENYTLTTGKNGFSVGPITIDSGITVTVPSGQRWLVL
jgi:hypothetical protein